MADQLFDEILPLGEGDFIELLRRTVPGHGHRRAARRTARGPGRLPALEPDGGERPDRRRRGGLRGGQALDRGLHRGAGHRPRGSARCRPAGRRRGSAGHRHPGRREQHPSPRRARWTARACRDPPPRLPAARRRPRDDDQPHRPAALPAAGAPGADGRAAAPTPVSSPPRSRRACASTRRSPASLRANAAECPVRGETIAAGSKLQLLYGSANRDPERFETPDEFRLDREPNELRRHVAFGWGIHFCIGAPLARQETRITFERLLARLDDIELAGRAASATSPSCCTA